MNKRLLSMFLALCMIVTMLPVSAMAEEIHTTIGGSGEIISFAPLTETEKTVSLGTSIDDLGLPETLTAMVRTAVSADENPVQDSGSPETATPATATEPEWEETTVDVPVRWISPDYDMNTEGEYIFAPEIEGYTVRAELPEITVTVGAAMLIDKTQAQETQMLTAQLAETRDFYIVLVSDSMAPSSLGLLSNDCGLSQISTADSDDYAPDDGTAMVKSYLYRAAVGQTITFHWGLGEEGFRGLLYAYYADDEPTLDATFGKQWAVLRNSGLIGFVSGGNQPIGLQFEVAASPVLSKPDAVTNYDIWVGGVQVTSANASNVLDDGTVTYDSDTNTLTLNDANITSVYTLSAARYGIYAPDGLNLKLVGTNAITLGSGDTAYGICSADHDLQISAEHNGSLTITTNGNFGIYSDNLTINSGEITAVSAVIWGTESVSISEGTVTSTGGVYGIVAPRLTVSGGTVTASGSTAALVSSGGSPDFTGMQVTASTNESGSPVVPYNTANLATYKYIKVESASTPPVLTEVADRTALQSAITGAAGDLDLKLSDSYIDTAGKLTIPGTCNYNITIDLNGRTLAGGSVSAIEYLSSGTLTITDSQSGGMVTSNAMGTIYAKGTGTVNLSGGTVRTAGSTESVAIWVGGNKTLNITGGTVIGIGFANYAIYSQNGTVNISGGTVSATGVNGKAICGETDSAGQLNISGGTVSATWTGGIAIDHQNTTIQTGTTNIIIQGSSRAMTSAPTLSGGVQCGASTNYDGSGSVAYNTASITTYKYLKFGLDVISPVLSAGNVSRTSDTEGTIDFTTDKAGTAYYLVVNSGASAPTSMAVKAGTSLGSVSGTVTGKAVTLTAGAKDIYVVVEDSADNISTPLKISAAYVAPDTTAPTVTSVTVPGNGTYSAGNNLDFTVTFDENVTVNTSSGTPYLSLIIGSTSRQATYVSGSGASNLVFRYTVQAGDSDSNGISIGSLILNGGTIQDGAGNNANLTLNSVGNMTGVLVDTSEAPSITSQPAPQTVNEGQSATFSVTATGTGLTYQWQVNTGSGFSYISNNGVYSGATTATLTITGATAGMNGYQYRSVVTGAYSPVATSTSALLTITDTRTELTSVFISDTTPTFGDILSATINPSTATVTYSWKADGSQVGTSATYEVKAADIGKTITLTVTGTGAYKGTVTSSVTSAVAAKDYSVTVDSTKSVVQGSGLSALPTANAGAVNGTLTWYSDSGRTKAVTDQNVRALVVDSVVTVYWSFTATTAGYVTTPKTGECVVTIASGAAQTLSFAESTVTKTVGDPIFTNVLTHSVGSGTVTYSSSNTSVAMVQPTTGEVAIVGAGTTIITANAARVPGVYAPGSASFTLTVNNAPIKTVSVGSQSGTATAGTAGSLTYPVTTANIANGIYAVSVANLPAGVTVGNSGNVTISGNSGTLTLTVADTAPAGTTGTLVLTLDGATSAAFSIVIGEPAPATYTIKADPTSMNFSSLTEGYTAPAAQTVTITNTGNSSVTLTQPTSTNYTIGTLSDTTLAANGTATFTVAPKAGLAVGNYNETLTVNTDHSTNATVELSFSVTAVPTYIVTFDPNGGTVGESSRSVASGTAVGTLPIPTRSDSYRFDGWYTEASGGTQISASTTINASVTYYAHWTYTGGGSGGGSGNGGSNNSSSSVIVTPPAADKPNSPTQGESKVPATSDGQGNVTVNITDKIVTDAFDKALADAKKNGNEQNGITVVLRVDAGSKTGSNVTVNLPKTVQDTIIAKKIVNTIVVVDNPDIRIGMDLATVQEINKQAKSDVNITATRTNSGKLTGDAKKAIGSRPVFDLKVNYSNDKTVSSFGAGSVSVTIPYTLGANENAGNVQAVYVDAKGKVHWLVNSVYDSVEKVLRFSTDHFSTYGIGYKQTNTAFTDIAGHWAKGDIEFVVSRGLFSGTSETKFSPNTAMTRGMFVTALGRLASADVSGYTKSSFSDVKADAYYMGYIEWASKNSIVNGTGNGKFAPDQSITREQMAVIMGNYAKTIGYTLPKVHIENIFTDNAKISTYAKEAVKQMQMAGVISGKNGNLFDPQGTATRAEVSAVLRRFVELAISSDTAQGWTMNDSGKWMYFKDGKPLTGKQDINGATYTFDQYGVTVDVPKNLRYTTYTVQKGDSFWSISRKLGCTMSELERLNNKSRFSIIYPGDVLRVPEK